MRRVLTLGIAVLAAAIAAGLLTAAPERQAFAPRQEPRGVGNLVVPGDRVTLVYDAGVRNATGSVYVRNDLRHSFVRIRLAAERGPSSTYSARVPGRLLRGRRLLYYAVLRKGRRKARVPATGVSSALVLTHPKVIRLGTHRFGRTRAADEIVATASTDEVGWQIPPPGQGPKAGPQSFLVGADRSIWLHDSFNDRMLVWDAGDPHTVVRIVPLPERTADNDVALGPQGSIYVTHGVGHGLGYRMVLKRLDPTGRALWTGRLDGDFFGNTEFMIGVNSSLRHGPDGTLHVLTGMFGRPGGEFGWMPVATADGRAIPRGRQHRGTDWPYQPIGAGRRMVTEVYTPKADGPVQEVRLAIVDQRGNLVRSWRVKSRTPINLHDTPDVLRGAPTLVLDVLDGSDASNRWEYVVLRLPASGAPATFSVPRLVFGDNILADIRMSSTAGGGLYQLSSDPSYGVRILRYAL